MLDLVPLSFIVPIPYCHPDPFSIVSSWWWHGLSYVGAVLWLYNNYYKIYISYVVEQKKAYCTYLFSHYPGICHCTILTVPLVVWVILCRGHLMVNNNYKPLKNISYIA